MTTFSRGLPLLLTVAPPTCDRLVEPASAGDVDAGEECGELQGVGRDIWDPREPARPEAGAAAESNGSEFDFSDTGE